MSSSGPYCWLPKISAFARDAARQPAEYRELDRQCRVERDPKALWFHEHPDVAPQVSHLRQVLLRIKVKLPHSSQLSPS
jgi:hypothetical protein